MIALLHANWTRKPSLSHRSCVAAPLGATPDRGKVLYWLLLRPGKEDTLNAGQQVDLFVGPTAVVSNVDIKYVSCDPNCCAILQLEQTASEALRLVDPMKLELNAH